MWSYRGMCGIQCLAAKEAGQYHDMVGYLYSMLEDEPKHVTLIREERELVFSAYDGVARQYKESIDNLRRALKFSEPWINRPETLDLGNEYEEELIGKLTSHLEKYFTLLEERLIPGAKSDISVSISYQTKLGQMHIYLIETSSGKRQEAYLNAASEAFGRALRLCTDLGGIINMEHLEALLQNYNFQSKFGSEIQSNSAFLFMERVFNEGAEEGIFNDVDPIGSFADVINEVESAIDGRQSTLNQIQKAKKLKTST